MVQKRGAKNFNRIRVPCTLLYTPMSTVLLQFFNITVNVLVLL